MKKIILASGSPRRKEILKNAGLDFEVHPSSFEENLKDLKFSYTKIENLAYNKAEAVADKIQEDAIVIGADTVVVLNNCILTKPHDRNEAIKMLHELSGVEHVVVTGICIINKYTNTTKVKSVTTKVRFEDLSDEVITNYVDNFKPFDKAGAYGIQELPPGFVKSVDGSLENVIGLCSETVINMLKE